MANDLGFYTLMQQTLQVANLPNIDVERLVEAMEDAVRTNLTEQLDEANYHNGDVKPSVTNEIDRAKLVLRWDTSTRDDSTNFAVYHNDEQVAYGRLNNETNWAHVTMTLSEDVDDEHDLEGYLVKAIEQRTIRVV